MENFIVFKKDANNYTPMQFEGTIHERGIDVRNKKDKMQFKSDSPISPYIFGDTILADISTDGKMTPMRRFEQYAQRNVILLNNVKAFKKGLKRIIDDLLLDSITKFNEQAANGTLNYTDVLNRIQDIKRKFDTLGVENILDEATYIHVAVSKERKDDPIIWPVVLETKQGKVKMDGFLDTGSSVTILDASLPIAEEMENPESFINISGITGVPTSLPQIGLKYRAKGKKSAAKFAVMPDLSKRLEGYKVLLGRDVYWQISDKGRML